MPDPIRVQLRPEALRDDVDEVVLEVLGDARDEGHAHGRAEEQRHATEELGGRVLLKLRRVLVDDVAEDQRIEQRKDLVDRRERERECHQAPVLLQVAEEEPHRCSTASGAGVIASMTALSRIIPSVSTI
jgi:hypothetical protein